jgi:hypothetical protein
LYLPAVVAMRHNPLLKAMSERLLGRGKAKMQVIGARYEEVGAFSFRDFKVPKAFRPQLFDCYPLTVQDSIYKFYSRFYPEFYPHLTCQYWSGASDFNPLDFYQIYSSDAPYEGAI